LSLKNAVAAVKKYKNFLITSHMSLEGDALGSEIAFYILIKKLGKRGLIVNEDGTPYGYEFLPKLGAIRRYKNKLNVSFDCLAVLDCSGLERTGQVYTLNKDNAAVLNIDHHISNEIFGDINWVEPKTSCCAEMIYKLYKEMHVPIDKEAAVCMYVGILTDTGSFRYSNTSSSTHQAAAELLKHDLDVPKIYKNINENVPFEDMKLLSRILPAIRLECQGRIAWFQVKQGLLRNKKLSFDLSEHILTFARAIKGVEVVALFKENLGTKNEIRVNFRSQGKVDVNKIAQMFGGGGHKAASGATIKGQIDTVRRKVVAKIREAVDKS